MESVVKLTAITVLAFIVAVVNSNDSNVQCCPPGQMIRIHNRSKTSCWEPEANVTSPLIIGCNDTGFIKATEDIDFSVDSYNQLVIRLQNFEVEYEAGSYCVGTSVLSRTNTPSVRRKLAVVCYEDEVRVIADEIFGYCMFVSSLFLFFTALIYILFRDLRDLLGKSIINFCFSLGVGLSILAVMKIVPYTDMDLCAARGFLAYFFVIASFFWTNAISIQILISMKRPSVLNYGWKEFIWYATYSWGSSAILALIMAVINFTPGDHLKPGLGLNNCWFFNTKQQWWYMYSVMTLLILINIGIFIYASFMLWRHSFSSSHIKALRYKFTMTLRLFFVMGVPWIFEMIGTMVKSHIVWEILDLMNSLQGVLVFLVLVVFRRRVIKLMHQRGWLDCIAGPVEKCLAVGEDEENVVQHTIGISMDESKLNGNGIAK